MFNLRQAEVVGNIETRTSILSYVTGKLFMYMDNRIATHIHYRITWFRETLWR